MTLEQELSLAAYVMPDGLFAGKTLDEILRNPKGERYLRFISRGRFRTETLDAVRAFLDTLTQPLNESEDMTR